MNGTLAHMNGRHTNLKINHYNQLFIIPTYSSQYLVAFCPFEAYFVISVVCDFHPMGIGYIFI